MPESQPGGTEKRAASGFTALLGQGIKQNIMGQATKVAAKQEEEDDDVDNVINRGFKNYFSILKQNLFDRVIPHILSFLLSLTPQQLTFLNKCQVNRLQEAPLYIPLEFKQSLHPFQLSLYGRSQLWKIPRGRYLSTPELSLSALVQPEQGQAFRHQMLRDHRFLKLIQDIPEFLGSLNEVQKRVLANAVRHDILLKYFFTSVSAEQMRAFEGQVVETRVGDADAEEVLEELAQQMPFATKAAKGMTNDPLLKIMDYKTEMCLMIDNISNVEVFRCIDVDMPDSYVANLQVNQIQRLMKIKTELQAPAPDVREVQLTLKRFIIDLDVKEAYELAVLNQFLLNEEELHAIEQRAPEQAFNTASSGVVARAEPADSSEEEERPEPARNFKFGGKAARKSLMSMDLDRMAAEAQSRGEQHFSFTNATAPGPDKANRNENLKMIQEGDSFLSGEDSDSPRNHKKANLFSGLYPPK